MNRVDVMLDLETLGTGRDACILAVGAVSFNLYTGQVLSEFYGKVQPAKSAAPGVIDPGTVEWWLTQSEAARTELLAGERLPLENVLHQFAKWLALLTPGTQPGAYRSELRLWSNGPTFDEVITADAYRRNGIPQPWNFRQSRCCRTILDLAMELGKFDPKTLKRVGTHHGALDDAKSQAAGVATMAMYLDPERTSRS